MTSATYRQSSHAGPRLISEIPRIGCSHAGLGCVWTQKKFETQLCSSAACWSNQVGGPSVYPYQPKGLWLELNNRPGFSKAYPQGTGDDLYRRSMYTFWKRTVPSPMLRTFDAPEREFCTIRRSRTNTPLQALLQLNGPQFVEAARELGERMMLEGGSSVDEQIAFGFRLVTARLPNKEELAVLREAYQDELQRLSSDQTAAMKLLQVGETPHNTQLPPTQLAAMASVARLLLNLDEAITKG
jgi:hypothetical protein